MSSAQAKVVAAPTGRKVFLFNDDDNVDSDADERGTVGPSADPAVAAGIERYIQKTASRGALPTRENRAGAAPKDGGSDDDTADAAANDDDDDLNADGEVDYEYMGRMTLKSTREALAEVLVEERNSRGGAQQPGAKESNSRGGAATGK